MPVGSRGLVPAFPPEKQLRGLGAFLGAGLIAVLAVLGQLVALAQLEFQLLHSAIDGGIEIRLLVFREQIIAFDSEPNRALESLFRRMRLMILLQGHSRVNQPAVDMFQAVNPAEHVLLNGCGQRNVVRAENEFHRRKTCVVIGGLPRNTLLFSEQIMAILTFSHPRLSSPTIRSNRRPYST